MTKDNIVDYLYDKRLEIFSLRFRDMLLAKVVADIHRYSLKQQFKMVSLWSITPIHCIDRGSALDKVNNRVKSLQKHKVEILKERILSKQKLLKIMPSVSGIKVIEDVKERYISFEGNGRLEAFKRVFDKQDKIMIEVEIYRLRERKKVLRRVNRVRHRNFIVEN